MKLVSLTHLFTLLLSGSESRGLETNTPKLYDLCWEVPTVNRNGRLVRETVAAVVDLCSRIRITAGLFDRERSFLCYHCPLLHDHVLHVDVLTVCTLSDHLGPQLESKTANCLFDR